MKSIKLVIIVPCFNESAVLMDTSNTLLKLIQTMINKAVVSNDSTLCFIDDGSVDSTWNIIESLSKSNKNIEGIKLSRNFGHQKALLAGLYSIEADAYVTIDADLQDDENSIIEMLNKFNEGFDIVYGIRKSRESDSIFKKKSALGFYKLMTFLGVNIVYNHADFRLMSERTVFALRKFPEKNLFLRAMIPLLGFQTSKVFYDRKKRMKGETKYPIRKMMSFAWDGVTSFSIVPLRLVTLSGLLSCFVGILLIIFSVWKWFEGETILGWTSLISIITIFSGVQLVALGIIGEYIGKIYNESKGRPNFIVQEKTN